MGKIKSALELALEKTSKITVDKEKIEENKYLKQGKIVISKLLKDPEYLINNSFKDVNKKQKKWMRQGMINVLMSNFVLPKDEESLTNIKKIEDAFYKVISNIKYLETIFSQLKSFFGEYLNEVEHVKGLIDKQYAPRLKQKEDELSKKLGREVQIDPAQDPEYISIVRNNLSQIEDKYQSILAKVKEDLLDALKSEI